jgi:hypothetical protein
LKTILGWGASTHGNRQGPEGGFFHSLKEKNMSTTATICATPPAIIIGGSPWFELRDILKATGHRPFFIRRSLLSLAGLRKFLHRSDKPQAPELLAQIDRRYTHPHCVTLQSHLAF